MATKIAAQDLEISNLKARIKILEDTDKGSAKLSGDDPPIKERSLETGEKAGVERSTKRGSNNTKEMVNVLTSMDAAKILTCGVQAVSVSHVAEVSTVGLVPTGSGLVPTVSAIFPTPSVVTPYLRRKGKEKMVESDMPKKKKLQEQIDVQMAREMEEQMAREDQRMDEQIARDAEIARIHAEEELQLLIDGLDRNNEVIAKHLQEYEESAAKLTIIETIDLINELQQKEFYMSVLRSHSGWKTKHFKGMTLEEIKEKLILVWKQIEDFVPMASKEEGDKVKRKGLRLEQGSAKKIKTSKEVSKEDLKEMMQLVPVEEVYVEALQVKHPIIDWEIHTEGKRDYWKIIRLGGNTAVYQFFVDMLKQFDREDLNQLWTLVIKAEGNDGVAVSCVEEDEFEEEEDPQEEDDDMEIDIEEDENKLELTYPYEEVDTLNPSPPASESEPDDEIEVENPIEHEDETIPASIHKWLLFQDNYSVARWRIHWFRRREKPKDKFYGKLILELGNEVHSSVEKGMAAMEKLVEKLGNTEDKVECKKLKNELKEARIMPPKSAPMTQAAIRRMIKDSIGATIAVERARQVKEYDVVAYTQRFNELALMCPRMVEPERVKVDAYIRGLTDNIKGEVTSSKPADLNEAVDAYIRGLTDNIKGEMTYSKPANLNEAVCMVHKLIEQKSQARDARILEGKKTKWESLQGGNSSGKGNRRDNSCHTLKNSQKQGNARAMVIPPTDGKLPLSFVDTRFCVMLDIDPIKIGASYEAELDDGRGGAAAVASPAGVLELDTYSSSEADPLECSPPPISVAPMVLPFLCSDNSESDTKIPERHVSPTPHDAMLTRALTTRKLVRPLHSHHLPLRHTSHHLDHFTFESSSSHSSSNHSSSGHSITGHSLSRHTPPDTTDTNSSTPSRFVHLSLARTPRCSEAYLRWRSAPLSTMYPLTTSESSARDSSSESSTGPSYERCRSPAATVISSIYATRASVPSRTNLLPPCKRFRDSISPEDSVEEIDTDVLEDIKADATAIEVAVNSDVEDRIYAGIGMEVDVGVDVEDEVEDEVESSDRGNMEVGVDVVAEIDIPDGTLMPDAVEHLKQRELEARSLIVGGERASLLEQIVSLERSNARLQGTMMMERARSNRFRRRVRFMKSELRQIRRTCNSSVVYKKVSSTWLSHVDPLCRPSHGGKEGNPQQKEYKEKGVIDSEFLGKRLISLQCKKQTIVANSTTEAEYVAAASCYGQVLWIQNQMLDYRFNFMNTKIYIDNESTICIVKNLVFHSETKHIKIRHHFIRDTYEKKLIQVIKIHTNHNVANLLPKAFDVGRFNFLVASIGLLNI
uniref:Putative ribonuclease H-like domain-containing protein n=1 Tax=Tanacetum cinerariifolium TaxID=118510 RepID=A0A6L2L8R8_TANCI|nr:putative ribonuclease H-like domain-containing protein [Tanacetum cinerariifolium]